MSPEYSENIKDPTSCLPCPLSSNSVLGAPSFSYFSLWVLVFSFSLSLILELHFFLSLLAIPLHLPSRPVHAVNISLSVSLCLSVSVPHHPFIPLIQSFLVCLPCTWPRLLKVSQSSSYHHARGQHKHFPLHGAPGVSQSILCCPLVPQTPPQGALSAASRVLQGLRGARPDRLGNILHPFLHASWVMPAAQREAP